VAKRQVIKPHHYRAFEMRLAGVPIKQIAEELGFSPRTVEKWFYAHPAIRAEWQRILDEHVERARNTLLRAAPAAAATIAKLAQDAVNENVRLGAAKDVLDRAGLKPAEKHEHSGPGGGPIQTQTMLLPQEEVEKKLREIGAL